VRARGLGCASAVNVQTPEEWPTLSFFASRSTSAKSRSSPRPSGPLAETSRRRERRSRNVIPFFAAVSRPAADAHVRSGDRDRDSEDDERRRDSIFVPLAHE